MGWKKDFKKINDVVAPKILGFKLTKSIEDYIMLKTDTLDLKELKELTKNSFLTNDHPDSSNRIYSSTIISILRYILNIPINTKMYITPYNFFNYTIADTKSFSRVSVDFRTEVMDDTLMTQFHLKPMEVEQFLVYLDDDENIINLDEISQYCGATIFVKAIDAINNFAPHNKSMILLHASELDEWVLYVWMQLKAAKIECCDLIQTKFPVLTPAPYYIIPDYESCSDDISPIHLKPNLDDIESYQRLVDRLKESASKEVLEIADKEYTNKMCLQLKLGELWPYYTRPSIDDFNLK